MKFQPGDKVRYLNATGGGMVTKVIDSRMVLVSDEEGFEVPTLISELIKVDPADPVARFFKEPDTAPAGRTRSREAGKRDQPEGQEEEERGKICKENGEPEDTWQSEPLPPQIIRNRHTEDIFLAFIPHDQKWLITGMVDVYLINNTSFDVIYNLFHRTALGHYVGADYGSVFANTRHLLQTVNREELNHWCAGSLQFLFHQEQQQRILPPFNSDFRIDGKKFHKEGAYRFSVLIGEKGMVVKIVSLSDYFPKPEEPVKDEVSPPVAATGVSEEEQPFIFRHQTEPRKAEMDLHIHALVEDPSNLQKQEILRFQEEYFLRGLESAMANHFRQVIFIHGVGNGTLRNLLIGHLKHTEGIEWFDAPRSGYGTGAVEVRIRHNRPLPADQ